MNWLALPWSTGNLQHAVVKYFSSISLCGGKHKLKYFLYVGCSVLWNVVKRIDKPKTIFPGVDCCGGHAFGKILIDDVINVKSIKN